MPRRQIATEGQDVLASVLTLAEAARVYNLRAKTISYWFDLGYISGRHTGGNILIYKPSIDFYLSRKKSYILS
jgi:hypothetical protein